jgi:hypothetical protein
VYIESNLTFSHHLSRISSSSFEYLRLISWLRRCLNFQSRFVLIHSLVLSRINYCASILHGTSKKASNCLQRILNSVMCLVLGRKKRDSVSDDMKRIGWLTFKQLAAHHLLCLIHRVITRGRPEYLSNLLTEIRRIDNPKAFRPMTYRHLFRLAYEDCTAFCSD